MKYCPNVDCPFYQEVGLVAEYQDSVAICSDCGTALMAGTAPDGFPPRSTASVALTGNRKLAVVTTVDSFATARWLKEQLSQAGIVSTIAVHNLSHDDALADLFDSADEEDEEDDDIAAGNEEDDSEIDDREEDAMGTVDADEIAGQRAVEQFTARTASAFDLQVFADEALQAIQLISEAWEEEMDADIDDEDDEDENEDEYAGISDDDDLIDDPWDDDEVEDDEVDQGIANSTPDALVRGQNVPQSRNWPMLLLTIVAVLLVLLFVLFSNFSNLLHF